MPNHDAAALNWNGKTIRAKFACKSTDADKLATAAHKALRHLGYTTIQLLEVDGTAVPYRLQYA